MDKHISNDYFNYSKPIIGQVLEFLKLDFYFHSGDGNFLTYTDFDKINEQI